MHQCAKRGKFEVKINSNPIFVDNNRFVPLFQLRNVNLFPEKNVSQFHEKFVRMFQEKFVKPNVKTFTGARSAMNHRSHVFMSLLTNFQIHCQYNQNCKINY